MCKIIEEKNVVEVKKIVLVFVKRMVKNVKIVILAHSFLVGRTEMVVLDFDLEN